MELDNAPLPPPVKRGRKPSRPACAVPATCTANYASAANFGGDPEDFEAVHNWQDMAETGWTTGVATTRFPPEGQDMLIGGYFNGQYRNMVEHSDERYACIGVEDDLRVEWYERCDNPGAWVWIATVTPAGIELRGMFQ